MVKYGWVIDKDHLFDPNAHSDRDDKGTMGPRDISPEHQEMLKKGEGKKFKMYDDDGELYYEGRIVGECNELEPLDDFGMPNAGCTDIQYKNKEGKWESV